MSKKPDKEKIVHVDYDRYAEYISAYGRWKAFNEALVRIGARKANYATEISEGVIAYNYEHFDLLKNSNADLYDYEKKRMLEVKSTSNWDSDLSSFSPNANFDGLFFGRLDFERDLLHVYDCNVTIDDVKPIKVNKNQTFAEQQEEKRRPRFSIIDKIIEPNNLEPELIINMKTGIIVADNR